MKIGILTLPLETNYGGNLQAFALQRTLIKMGHDVYTIDRHNRKQYPSVMHHLGGFCKRLFLHYLRGKKNVSILWNPFVTESDYAEISKHTQSFINKNIRLTRKVFSDQLSQIDEEYQFDAYVVGSDQVWLSNYCPNSFLDFVKRPGVTKVVYAASCGSKSFLGDSAILKSCKALAHEFSGISVRERELVTCCSEKLKVKATWVLDPTMLLDATEYLSVVNTGDDSTAVVFSYILDQSSQKDEIVDRVSKMLQLPIVNGNRVTAQGVAAQYPSVDEWIANLNRSRFVITDSFHGTVFAILFNKPFIAIGNAKRGLGRFESLLSIFGLQDRLVMDISSVDVPRLLDSTIDFDEVNRVLQEWRTDSIQFLLQSLSKK